DRIYGFNEMGIARVRKRRSANKLSIERVYGLIDTTGKVVLDCIYRKIRPQENINLIIVQDENKKYGAVDKSGKTIIPYEYARIYDFDKNGVAKFKQYSEKTSVNSFYGIMNIEGIVLTDDNYSSIGSFTNGYAVVGKDEKYGVINLAGRLITKIEYEEIKPFNDKGFAIVKNENGYGVINKNGLEIILLFFEKVSDHGHFFLAEKGGKKFAIDLAGRCIDKEHQNRYNLLIEEYHKQ
ncbi:MAG: WG repeat-containing protein, partial [Bacteroidota bacterium]